MGSSSFQSTVSIRDGAASVVVEVRFDVAAYDSAECSDEVVYLTRGCATHRVCYTDSVDADFVNGRVDGEEVNQIGTERVFRGEPNFNAFGLDELDDLNRCVLDICHVFAMGMLS